MHHYFTMDFHIYYSEGIGGGDGGGGRGCGWKGDKKGEVGSGSEGGREIRKG